MGSHIYAFQKGENDMKYTNRELTKKFVSKFLDKGFKLPRTVNTEMIISRPIYLGYDWSIQYVSQDTYKIKSLAPTAVLRYNEEKTI